MRATKFRAWDENEKRMIYSEKREEKRFVGFGFYHDSGWDYNDFIFMQYTGLTDKNGKEIYEGDVVKFVNNLDKISYYIVEWRKESCGFEPYSDSIDNCGCCGTGLKGGETEVVGNILENPELTEKCSLIKDGLWVYPETEAKK